MVRALLDIHLKVIRVFQMQTLSLLLLRTGRVHLDGVRMVIIAWQIVQTLKLLYLKMVHAHQDIVRMVIIACKIS